MKKNEVMPFIFGISGLVLTKEEIVFFQTNQVKGFILFRRNIDYANPNEALKKLADLTGSLRKLYDHEITILIDEEGGRVARLKPPIIEKEFPPAGDFGILYDQNKEKALKDTEDNYFNIMSLLKKLNIDSPCAPVCDLRFEGAHDVIGDRSFGEEVSKVIDLSTAAIKGILKAGGIAIIKHMPGHGRSKSDSHLELPIVDTKLEELEKTDFAIFKQLSLIFKEEIKEGLVWAMTAHIKYESLDNKNPVTLSKAAINYIRKEINFTGQLISDAIEMKALKDPLQKIAIEVLQAGCDIVLHCTGNLEQMTNICAAYNQQLIGDIE